jgi:hypothetical protein
MPAAGVPPPDDPLGGKPVLLRPETFERHEAAFSQVEEANTARYPMVGRGRTTKPSTGTWGYLAPGQVISAASGLTLGSGPVTLCSRSGGTLTPDGETVTVYNSGGVLTGPNALALDWTDGVWAVCECIDTPICVLVQDLCGPQPSYIQYIKACDYWIDVSKQKISDANGDHFWQGAGGNATALIPFDSDNLWGSVPGYVPTMWCSACGGTPLNQNGATGTDDLADLAFYWHPDLGCWQSLDLSWSPPASFYADAAYGMCDPGDGATVKYFYRVFCDGDNLRCELWTLPVEQCPYDDAICGYYLGESGSSVAPALVKLLTSTVSPTCDADAVAAAFTFDSIDAGCVDLVDPPSANLSVTLPKPGCDTLVSGRGVYYYFWTYQPTTVTLTLRVYADPCPEAPLAANWATSIAADWNYDRYSPPSAGPWYVDYVVAVEPTCGSTYSASFSFSKPATSFYGGTGSPPHDQTTLPVTSATMTAPVVQTNYIAGAVATMVDQDGATVATCTTDHSGTCCMVPPEPGQYWISVSVSGCECTFSGGDAQEINFEPPPCNESVSCSACGGVELGVKGATGTDSHFSNFKLTHDYPTGTWQTGHFSWSAPAMYYDDSVARECYDASGSYIEYFYRVFCDGDNLTCELWTYPLGSCRYDDSFCGYYLGDAQTGEPLVLVNTWTSSATPTCDGSMMTATFTFAPLDAGCADLTPPPSTTMTVHLPQIPLNHVVCCGDNGLPIPRANLNFSWSGPGGSGSETLVYTPSGNTASWIGAHGRYGCGGLNAFGQNFSGTPAYYTWFPLYMRWTVGGNTYEVYE